MSVLGEGTNELSLRESAIEVSFRSLALPRPLPFVLRKSKESSETHILAIPKFDSTITTRSENDSLSSPPHNVDTGGMSTEGKIKLSGLGVPYADGGVLGRRGETRGGNVAVEGGRVSDE